MLALTINGNTERIPDAQQEAAMQRYWAARQQGDQTANLERLPDGPDDDDPPTSPGQVSTLARERVQLHESWLEEAGFSVPPPLYAPGTRVAKLGDDNFRLERKRVEHLPMFTGASSAVQRQIALEDREDFTADLSELTMSEDGHLLVGDTPVALQRGAFYQLATLSGFGMGARYLAEKCPADLRATNFNQQMQLARSRAITLRTRSGSSGRQAFATVTPAYAPVDTDQVLDAVSGLLADAHVEMRYDGSGVRATALFMPDHVVELAAGDIFRVGVRIETDDTGRGRIRVSGVVFRNLCLNLIIIGEGEVETVSQVHRGDPTRILQTVREGVQAAREKVGDFLDSWKHARTVPVDAKQLLRQWIEQRTVRLPGLRSGAERDLVVETLLAAWQKEPDDSLAGAVSALTRAAHENPLWGVDIREGIERQAARLVMVPR